MKNIIPHIVSLLIIYFVFSFIKWEFNPELWEQDRRVGFIIIACCISGFISVMLYFNEDKKK
jgi:hypothetical protein